MAKTGWVEILMFSLVSSKFLAMRNKTLYSVCGSANKIKKISDCALERAKSSFCAFWAGQSGQFNFSVFFSLPAPTLVMTKGLLTFAAPQNAQNNDFFHVHKNRV
jgi:hypothetical protein